MPAHTFHLIPHTHWDREWYLTQAGFLARLVPLMDDLLDRLEREPEFRSFLLDGQTILLHDYLAVRPEQRERIARLVQGGRLQAGPWYVLADELIPSGESLIRNLLAGRADAESFGGRSDVLYSPDAFGHPAVMPMLAAEFGIPHGVLWRGLGGEPGQERDFYRWSGPDKREILLYHLPPDGYEVGSALPADRERLAEAWPPVRAALVNRAATPHVAVFVGADHHAAHPALGALCRLLAELEPESTVRISRLDEFLRAAASALPLVPALRGELRWSYGYTWTLQGVHATRAPLKRRHAEVELLLERVAEPLVALSEWQAAGGGRQLLDHAWRTLLQCQFHDSIGGCTADPVARQVEARLEDVEALGRELARTRLDALVGNDPDLARERPATATPRLLLWNPAARRRGGVVLVDLTWFRRDVLVGPPGARIPKTGTGPSDADLAAALGGLPFQPLGRSRRHERLDAPHHYPDQDEVEVVRVAVRVPEVAGLGISELAPPRPLPRGASSRPAPVRVATGRVDNGLVEVIVGTDGTLGLFDRSSGMRFRGLLALESDRDVGDTYTYAPLPSDRVRRSGPPVATRVLADGQLVGALEVWVGLERITPRLVISLQAGSPAVRCTLEFNNRVSDHRLRLRCPTGIAGAIATAGGPFGAVVRPPSPLPERRYPRETPVSTAPAHRFVACTDAEAGLALLAPGFFEYELTPAGDLLMTVLRSVGQLSRDDLPTRPGHAAWPVATPLAQCPGPGRLQLAFCCVTASALNGGAALSELWEDVFLPTRGVWLRQATPLRIPPGDLRLEGDGLVFSALKPAADGAGVILRCYNATDRATRGAWRLPLPVSSARRVRADEREGTDLALDEGGRAVRFSAAPRELVTILLAPALPRDGGSR